MQKYLIAGLCAALLVLGWLYRDANNELTDTKTALAVAVEANKANQESIARLERSIGNTNEVLAKWNEDRTTLAEVRSATRQAIKEAMRDETFKAWAASLVPDSAWRLLREAPGADGNGPLVPAAGASGRLPGDKATGAGNKR